MGYGVTVHVWEQKFMCRVEGGAALGDSEQEAAREGGVE